MLRSGPTAAGIDTGGDTIVVAQLDAQRPTGRQPLRWPLRATSHNTVAMREINVLCVIVEPGFFSISEVVELLNVPKRGRAPS